jgi:ferredoxin
MELDLSVMADLTLSDEEKASLLPPKEVVSAGLYCQQCEQCIPQCPSKLDIPTLMRSYMYAYGYKNFEKARQTVDLTDLSRMGCNSCDTCSVNCAVGFDIKGKVLDITRIKDIPREFLS